MTNAPRNAREYYARLRRVPIGDVVREMIPDRITRESESEMKLDCPNHASQSKTSLGVSLEKSIWYCFGCRCGGDTLMFAEFVLSGAVTKQVSGAQTTESHGKARDLVAKVAGLKPLSEMVPKADAEAEERSELKNRRTFQALTALAEIQCEGLLKDEEILAWCFEKWALTPEIIKSARIGLSDEADHSPLLAKGFTVEEITSTGTYSPTRDESYTPFFKRRMTIPYFRDGQVVYMAGRKTPKTPDGDWEKGKYKKLPIYNESSKQHVSRAIRNDVLFGEDVLATRPKTVVIVEGVLDAVIAQAAGLAAISPCTVQMKEADEARLLKAIERYQVERIVVVFDEEISGAGFYGSLNVAGALLRGGVDCRVGLLPLTAKQDTARSELRSIVGPELWAKLLDAEMKGRADILTNVKKEHPELVERIDALVEAAKIDVAEWFRTGGTPAAFQAILDAARKPFEFAISRVQPSEDKAALAKAIQPSLKLISDLPPIEQDEALKSLKERTGLPLGALKKELSAASKKAEAARPKKRSSGNTGTADSSSSEESKPTLEVTGGDLPALVDSIDDLLAAQREWPVFRYGEALVELIEPDGAPSGSAGLGATRVWPRRLDHYRVADIATGCARFVRLNEKGKETPLDCPERTARTLLSRGPSRKARNLVGIIECPTIRPDGSLLDKPGYDEVTGLFLARGSFGPLSIPEAPTLEDARRAVRALANPFLDFPFERQSCLAAALACIVTGVVRRQLPTAPMFGFSARTMATGKTLLSDAASLIATGRSAAVTTFGTDETETRKQMLALLMEGAGTIVIDNADGAIKGSALCAILTSSTFQGRILGQSKIAEVPTNALLIVNGNNLLFEGDIATRVVVSFLDAQLESPGERIFKNDLRADLLALRPILLTAVLTLLRAYIVAGKPDLGLTPFGRFERWSEMVRHPLVWAGLEDPCTGAERIRAVDPADHRLRSLIASLSSAFDCKPQTVADLCKATDSDLRDAIVEIAGGTFGEIDRRKLGQFLHKCEGRIVDGRRIKREGNRNGSAVWTIETVPISVANESGSSAAPRGSRGCRGSLQTLQGELKEKESGWREPSSSCNASPGSVGVIPHIPYIPVAESNSNAGGARLGETDVRTAGSLSARNGRGHDEPTVVTTPTPPCDRKPFSVSERCYRCHGTRFGRLRVPGTGPDVCQTCSPASDPGDGRWEFTEVAASNGVARHTETVLDPGTGPDRDADSTRVAPEPGDRHATPPSDVPPCPPTSPSIDAVKSSDPSDAGNAVATVPIDAVKSSDPSDADAAISDGAR